MKAALLGKADIFDVLRLWKLKDFPAVLLDDIRVELKPGDNLLLGRDLLR